MSDDFDMATKRYRVAEALSAPFDFDDPIRERLREELLDSEVWSDKKIDLLFRVIVQGERGR